MLLNQKINELLAVREEDHDLEWLKAGLQTALELEFFTIPPYLAARWSIKNRSDFASRSIRVIVLEEMLHMGLVANMLVALGAVPQFNDRQKVPVYPDELPGRINPGLEISLQGLSNRSLETFMAIELPEEGSVVELENEILSDLSEQPSTIGAFYTAIQTAFDSLQPAISPINQQQDSSLKLFIINNADDVRKAITEIKRQGEGASGSPVDTSPTDLAHYYRFGEIFHGRKLRQDAATGKWKFDGEPIVFPDVFPVAVVPAGGYRREDVSETVAAALEQFDQIYTEMLNHLQSAWEGTDGALDEAVFSMFGLTSSALQLVSTPIPNGNGNYCPCFRLV